MARRKKPEASRKFFKDYVRRDFDDALVVLVESVETATDQHVAGICSKILMKILRKESIDHDMRKGMIRDEWSVHHV